MTNTTKQYYTVKELADILGVSRVTVFNRIKKGEISAEKMGSNYIIKAKDLPYITGEKLDKKTKKKIALGVSKVLDEYGEALNLLAKE